MSKGTKGPQRYKKSIVIFVITLMLLVIIGVGYYVSTNTVTLDEGTTPSTSVVPGKTSLSCETTNDCATVCGDDPCLIGSCNITLGSCVCLSQC